MKARCNYRRLNGAMNGANDLVLSGAGTTVLNGAIGGGTALASLTANTDLTVGNGSIITSGDQLYANAVMTTSDTTFRSSGVGSRSVTFNNAIAGKTRSRCSPSG